VTDGSDPYPGFPDINAGNDLLMLRSDALLHRYMRLSAAVMLIQGKAFIPTLKNLQETDPLECRIWKRRRGYGRLFDSVAESTSRDWLAGKMAEWEQKFIKNNQYGFTTISHFVDAWLDQLGERRCVWCWYGGEDQSMAQWKIYGERGVAIKSSLSRIRGAMPADIVREYSSAGFVRYPTSAELAFKTDTEVKQWLTRPYYFKDKAYEHEREVRFVFAVNSDLADVSGGGLTIQIDPGKLIEKIIISPDVFRSEGKSLKSMFEKMVEQIGNIRIEISDLLSTNQGQSELTERWNKLMDAPFESLTMDCDPRVNSELPSELFFPV
jgi:hypothetical protein